jgi:hypothetical protein
MTTLREAAQQALEALETPIHEQALMQRQNSITALRAALDAPPPEPVGWVYINRATGERTFSRHMAGVVNHTEVVEVPVYAEPPRPKS